MCGFVGFADFKNDISSKRNILTSGLVATYPFISSAIFDETGIFIGTNIYNNSLVFKMEYNKFSILFTGDIEKVAEEAILKKYKEANDLKSTILKVAHHGSKSS